MLNSKQVNEVGLGRVDVLSHTVTIRRKHYLPFPWFCQIAQHGEVLQTAAFGTFK